MKQSIQSIIKAEEKRQSEFIELIASENYQSEDVLAAQASVFANKYAEGFPGKRYYGGQEFTDQVESLAIERTKKLFGADHANVQALSGAAANLGVYNALMQPGDAILGMSLSHGGHLTHGAPVTLVSKIYDFHVYKTENWRINFDTIRQLALDVQPKVILAWFSAYPRNLDWTKFAEIAKRSWSCGLCGCITYWGLYCGWSDGKSTGLRLPCFDVDKPTNHLEDRGIFDSKQMNSQQSYEKPRRYHRKYPTRIDRSIFPGIQWGPHMNSIAAIAVALQEATTKKFKTYAQQTIANAQVLATELLERDYNLVTGGTDNHMVIVDFSHSGLSGRQVQQMLEKAGISSSASTIPDDPNPPYKPSGLRLGTPAMTTRGLTEDGIKKNCLLYWRSNKKPWRWCEILSLRQEVVEFCKGFPLP